jgi:alpha-tubulin suppressor-like RCC1 family protein
MSPLEPTTNFKDSNGVDLGSKLITKDYLISVYPSIGQQIGIPPELWVWGDGVNGKLGNNDTTIKSTPVTSSAGGTNWKQVSCSPNAHTAAIKTDGTLWTWGQGSSGKLGTNDTTDRSTPVTTFAGGTNWKQVSSGTNHTAAIKTDGTLWTWGSNDGGQLGTNDTTNRSTPVTTFAGGTDWKQVSGGGGHTAAIKTDGTLWAWGSGYQGRLGNNVGGTTLNTTIAFRSTPVTTFAGGTNWKQVSCGNDHTAAIKTDGTLWTWGRANYGKLGIGSLLANRSTPVTTFVGGTNWKQVSISSFNSAAIKTDGTLWTWGLGSGGRLGNNASTDRPTPGTTFAGGTNWKQLSNKANITLAIKTDGTLWGWGVGNRGQLGSNDTDSRSTPITTFAGGTNWKQVDCGNDHIAAIKSVDF